tara:strand:+ start:434 stop:793 length:360 start_codon:yes stop_codon:yes gene_type:complete
LISISSTFIALETVSLKSLLADKGSSFNFVFEAPFSSFLTKFFVACCSTNFLTTFFFIFSGFLNVAELVLVLLSLEGLKGLFFSIENVFLPSLEREEISIFLVTPVEIDKVFFFSFGLP